MTKKVFLLAVGIVVAIIAIAGGYLFFFKEKTRTSSYQTPSETVNSKEDVYKIKGIGFKKEAWAEYKMEGYGTRYEGGKVKPLISRMLAKLVSFPIKGKEYFGIEIDMLDEKGEYEGTSFAILFEKEGSGSYYLSKIKGSYSSAKNNGTPTLCISEAFSGNKDIPEYFDKKSIEEEYKVDLSTWQFVGGDEMTLESGRKIKVYKFKIDMGTYGTRDLWLSPEVPTYLVLNRETIEVKSRSITLTDFGMDGGLPNFTDEDLRSCDSEASGNLPSEISKMSCRTDVDCACGVDKETGKCAFGNKKFIDTSKECPDFCTGFAGNIKIKCVNNLCTPEFVR